MLLGVADVTSPHGLYMSYLSFLTATVAIPVWLLILMVVAMTPFFLKLYRLWRRFRGADQPDRMHEGQSVLMKLVSIRRSAPSGKKAAPAAKARTDEQKVNMGRVLKVLVSQGETGMLLQSIADRSGIATTQAKQAVERLLDKQLIEEVPGMTGTKYFLTGLGKNYCARKGLMQTAGR